MDTIRKRPAMPHEQCDKTPETNLVVKRDLPARPLDLLFPLDASAPDIPTSPSSDATRAPNSTPSPLLRRITPKPRRLAAPASVGTPDWSLSAGAAVVLLGFAIAFGTYVTLTQRDAMQSRLRRIVSQNELRAASHHDRPTIGERTQELARTLREQIEALRSLDVADAAAIAGTAAIPTANAHSSTLASSAPSLPPRSAPPASNKTSASQIAAKPLAPPLPQPAPRARQAASTEPTRARVVATTTPRDHKVSANPAKPASSECGARSPCVETTAQSSRKPVKTTTTTTAAPQQDVKAHTAAVRSVAAKAPAAPVPHTAPPLPTVQAYEQPDTGPAVPAVNDTRQLFRQH
ncbi:hypothetical protein [Paraburkholderia diazotrophica]|uniref:Uncharacterized protein n=1 Tax=Paraburkholderia diazotrophica TaxID=667676 RepID=A0A1H6UFP0_9BURK|nr:hypothetical protein [Paraburkholderia diazotrophica]SEI90446.1 hypothetical protein SAMN05192539_10053 [Paraburkholderia diazotrophica]